MSVGCDNLIGYINDSLSIECETEHRLLDKNNDETGYVDYFWKVENSLEILLEYEKQQKHPDTNVLKVWPYIESKPNVKLLLIQYFENRNVQNMTSRMRLSIFLSKKLESLYPSNFKYFGFFGDDFNLKNAIEKLGDLKKWAY